MKIRYIAMTLAIMSLTILTPNKNAYASSYWTQKNGNWYYLSDSSKIITGWVQDNSKWYYLGTDSKMKVGWIQDGGNWYYLNSDGSMAHDTTISGYYLGSNGAWTTASTSSSSGNVTGISYTELINRIDNLGFVDKKYYSVADVGNVVAGYGWYWKNHDCGDIGVYDSGGFAVSLEKNDAEFNRAIIQIFNWLLPTQGNELNHILCTNPQNETLTMDGRTVKIDLSSSSICVVITG